MNTYVSTFISGLKEVVEVELKKYLKNIQVDLLLDGLIIYRSNSSKDIILNIRFLNNTFILFKLFGGSERTSLSNTVKNVLQNPNLIAQVPIDFFNGKNSFRIIASVENQIVSIDKKQLENLEKLFVDRLHLKVNRALPDFEVWFLSRSEGYTLVCLRITNNPNYEKVLHKGELRPELANMLCLLADLKSSDVVIDPFAGYGSIPVECSKSFSVKKIIAGEKNKSVYKTLQERISRNAQKIIVGRWNALKLDSLTDNSVDKIITDPPWGFYDNEIVDLKEFYRNMFREFVRILKPGGLIVILMGQKEIFKDLIKEFIGLKLEKEYEILVSGRKSSIYKIKCLKT